MSSRWHRDRRPLDVHAVPRTARGVTTTRLAAAVTALALTLAATPVLASAPAHARTADCGIRGSMPQERLVGSTGAVTDIRTGRHGCFDRLVLQVSGEVDGYLVRYVDQVRQDGSGELVPLRGGARLQVVVTAPTMPTDAWFLPNGELLDPRGYRTFRHLAWAGSFEGQSTLGLGVRARLPFRVLVLDGPGTGSRLVVDVAHRW